MIVISQSRDKMVKIENCDLVTVRDNEILAYSPQFPAKYYCDPHGRDGFMENCVVIGYFTDEAKAYKVMERMAIALKNFEDVFSIPQELDEKFFEDIGACGKRKKS